MSKCLHLLQEKLAADLAGLVDCLSDSDEGIVHVIITVCLCVVSLVIVKVIY